jgi:hypothetical protein
MYKRSASILRMLAVAGVLILVLLARRNPGLVQADGQGALGLSATSAATPPDYPLRCRGTAGMANAEGKNLIVEFSKGDRPAGEGLKAGQCSWDDRGLRPYEPTRIIDSLHGNEGAKDIAVHINSGDIWTFWVYNAGTFFRAVNCWQGTPKHKPQPID